MNDSTRFFRKEDIREYDIRDLHEKTLKINVVENEGWLLVAGKDLETNHIYVLKEVKK